MERVDRELFPFQLVLEKACCFAEEVADGWVYELETKD